MRWLLTIIALCLPCFATAQGAATLIADNVTLNGEDQLIASGNVEVIFGESRLTAGAILFDRPSDTLQITGPIFIKDANGSVLIADSATLDPRLENGILQGARLVLDQELQLAANQIDRVDGRYSQLYKTTATSCRVCGDRAPLWEIRAERVIQDGLEKQLYFENATLRVRGVPVFWVPRMRLPDPSLERATGFLVPEQRNTTQLGSGVKIPYFITLGDSRDVTVTPYLSPETRTLELDYRQAFVNGNLRLRTAVTEDTLVADTRSYIFANGDFDLSGGYQLDFDIEATSDPAYLLDYGYSDKDRLDSAVSLLRVQDTALFRTRLTFYESLRDDETNSSLPPVIADLSHEARQNPAFGGTLRFGASLDTAYRPSEADGATGRDVTRGGVTGSWSEAWVMPAGFEFGFETGARADLYLIDDDSTFARNDLQFVPSARATLRWPLGNTQADGTTHIIEPAINLSWADAYGGTPPNEDSTRTELDRGNLLAVSRFAGEDAVESGPQLAYGVSWTRLGAGGGTSTLSLGQVLRLEEPSGFTASSGLADKRSDLLVAGQLTVPGGFLFDGRSLWEGSDGLNSADARITWRNDTIQLGANYNWQVADPAEDRPDTVSEVSFESAVRINNQWTLELDGRYDVAADRAVRADIGVQWQNECVTVDVSASRRFTSSSTVEPTTTFGISGSIGGFSTGQRAAGVAASCGN